MSVSTTVSIEQLRAAIDRVLDDVADKHGPVVDLGADYYYVMPAATTYDVGTTPDPTSFTIGSLVDDVELVDELAPSPTDQMPERRDLVIWHDLAHLTGIFQRLAALDLP
ncbi:hypothetical protein ICW40_16525 [Actinotalea ferrariae]|uniref:hypothetical protein n=1 Tax=Actinotalea ferrariae TaxID=1386098 RepID=UPI001C8B963D|nr:hypothetical protein [Actinotalea ferrariae]MBX9246401.1 hypothetical protein [Actinotalea ferrariae]